MWAHLSVPHLMTRGDHDLGGLQDARITLGAAFENGDDGIGPTRPHLLMEMISDESQISLMACSSPTAL